MGTEFSAAGCPTNEILAAEPRVVGRVAGPAMVKRTTLRVISFVLLAASGALCQGEGPSGNLLHGLRFDGSNSFQAQRQEMPTLRSLPDAPSVQRAPQAGKFQTFVNEARSPLTLGAVGVNAAIIRETDSEQIAPVSGEWLRGTRRLLSRLSRSGSTSGRGLLAVQLSQDGAIALAGRTRRLTGSHSWPGLVAPRPGEMQIA